MIVGLKEVFGAPTFDRQAEQRMGNYFRSSLSRLRVKGEVNVRGSVAGG